MVRAVAWALLLTALAGAGGAQEPEAPRRMALTFDDLPAQRAERLPDERLRAILPAIQRTLTSAGAPAIGFVNESKLYRGGELEPERLKLLADWLDAGFELGNHTFSHPDLHRTDLEAFEAEVLRGQELTAGLAAARGRPLRYFRHPMLHTGRDLETKHGLEAFLARHGYRVAPVTIDNSEWIFARAYDEALDRADEGLARRLGESFVDYMEDMTAYYEAQSVEIVGREIPQILLLHANSLNADYLADLLERLRRRGYELIDLDTALADPAYASEDTYTGPGGITWLHRWAITRELDRSIFRGEPTTPEWVQDTAGIRE